MYHPRQCYDASQWFERIKDLESKWIEAKVESQADSQKKRKKQVKKKTKIRGGGKRDTTTHGTRAPHTARTPVNRSPVAQDTAHETQHTERAHR